MSISVGSTLVFTVGPDEHARLKKNVGDEIEVEVTRVDGLVCDVRAPGFERSNVRFAFESQRGCVHLPPDPEVSEELLDSLSEEGRAEFDETGKVPVTAGSKGKASKGKAH